MDVTPYWMKSASMPRYSSLDRNLEVDTVVVGAGITGLTAAYLLKRAGHKVAVLDRWRAGGFDTMHTTAHVTCVTDLDLRELVKNFGRDHAQAVWDAGLAAIDQLDTIIRDEGIPCDWRWVTGYRYQERGANRETDTDGLREEAQVAADLGFDAHYLDVVPTVGTAGIAFEGQAKFHPRKYLARLAELIHGDGSLIFEETDCDEVTADPMRVKCAEYTIATNYVVIATHTPLMGKTSIASATLLQTRLYLYTSYVIGGRLPRGTVGEGLLWDTADPYHYVRVDPAADHDDVIVGGEDHKTGQDADTASCFRKLETHARALFPALEVTDRWSGQVIETNDGLPFIGETSANQFAATGYAGNGMTFGTLAGMMARDAALGLENPWRDLFDVGRTKIKGGVWDYLKENIDYPYYIVRDRFAGTEGKSTRAVRRGEGKILTLNGRKAAVARATDGRVTMLSPICTHMGCLVAWNNAERTWDCPCHGSRFKPDGDVISGPAEAPLKPFE